LAIARVLGGKLGVATCLESLARVAAAQGQPERAAQLFGAAALRDALGAPLPPADRADYERQVAAVRATLGEEAFAAVWAEGRGMPLEEAAAFAMAETAGG
jgi:hypothetical protein